MPAIYAPEAPATKIYKFERRAVIVDGLRKQAYLPDTIPAGAIIFNAPRPIYGDVTWNAVSICGRFFALILERPDADRCQDEAPRSWMVKENQSLAAVVLRPVTEAQAQAEIEAHYRSNERLARYLEKWKESEQWAEHWFQAWFDRFGWDTCEVTA